MKLSGILILIACMQVSAAVYSQQVTLDVKDSKLDKVFTEIRKQTGYNFLYNNTLLKKAVPVTINANRQSLNETLNSLFANQPLSYTIIEKTIVVKEKQKSIYDEAVDMFNNVLKNIQLNFDLKGTVTDENGEPLPGVTIVLKLPNAPARTTVSDASGRYSFRSVPENATLLFNMIGFKTQEVPVGNKGQVNVKMLPDVEELKDVVITGYQQINKDSFTGNAVIVKGEDLKRANPQNLLKSMQMFDPSFRLADNNLRGSNPNALPNITVRGSSALPTGGEDILRRDEINNTVNMPVFILDGFEVNLQKVYDLDMNRIESVTLLKDAAATSVYGSRAANGVMVITTRAPKEGSLQVSYTYDMNVSGPDLSQYSVLDASQKLQYEVLAGVYDASKLENQGLSQQFLDQLYYNKFANVIGGVNTYWLSQPLRTAVGQSHSLYLEGGSPVFRYGVDMRYQNMPGVMKGNNRDRYSGGMNFRYNKNNKFMFRNDLSIARVEGKESPYGSFSQYARMNPYYSKTDEFGNVIRELETWDDNRNNIEHVYNPLYDAGLSSFDKSFYTEIIDNFSAEMNLGKGLRLTGVLSLTSRATTGDVFKSPLANEFNDYEASRANEKGRYTNNERKETIWDGNVRLNYLKQVDKSFFNVALGTNVRTEMSDMRQFEAIGFANDRFAGIGFAQGYAEDGKPSSRVDRSRLLGAFFNVNYSFDNRYLIDLGSRLDGSSKFGTDNKVAPFWSVGLGWNIHKEKFFKSNVISELRLRSSTGLLGSVSFEPNISKTTFEYINGQWYSTGIGAVVRNFGNSELAWQKTRTTDIGMDIGLFKNRIYISPRYYKKLTKDILADVTLAPSTGFASYKANLGDMQNKGAEVNMRVEAFRNKDWSVSLNANMATNKNKILKISESLKAYNDRVNETQTKDPKDGGIKGVPLLRFEEGQSIDAIYAVRSLGVDPENGREMFVKRDGTLTYDWDVRDQVVVGVGTPKVAGSFGATFSYKRFMLTASFETRLGGDRYNESLVDRVENADPKYNVDIRVFEGKWKQSGDLTYFKNIADLGKTYVTSRFVQQENLVNFQSLNLYYDFGKAFARKLAMSNFTLSCTANDVYRWSTIKEERGIDSPFSRNFNFSLRGTF